MINNEIKEIKVLIEKTVELRDSLLNTELSPEMAEKINYDNQIDFLSCQINEMRWQVRVAEEKVQKENPYWNKVNATCTKKEAADKKRREKRMTKYSA